MRVSVLDVYLTCAYNIDESGKMSCEVEIVLIISKIERNVYGLIALNFLEEKLLIRDLHSLITARSERWIRLVNSAKLYDMLVQ